jgi:VanZ family protein
VTVPARRGARVVWGVLLALWCAASWKLSSERDPASYVGVDLELPDKLVHGIEYAAGGFLAAAAFLGERRSRTWIAALAFCVAWGALDEFHQSFVPGRDATVADLAADAAGGALGALVFVRWAGRRSGAGRGYDGPDELNEERRPT